MALNQINPIGPFESGSGVKKTQGAQSRKDVSSFKDTLTGFMKDVNDAQNKADKSIERLAAGEINDVHQVMNAAQEAKVAFNMMMEVRNKVMDAYQEVMRIRI